jgi:hypothetical protein
MLRSERVSFVSRATLTIIVLVFALASQAANGQIASAGNKNTPELQAYLKLVYDSIGARWYSLIVGKAEWAKLGTIRIDFFIDPNGHVKKLKVLDHAGGHVSEEIAREAIEDVRLPPIPKPLRRQLRTPDLECDIKFTMFDNKSGSTTPPPAGD